MGQLEAKHERSSKAFDVFRRAIEEGDTAELESLVADNIYFIVPPDIIRMVKGAAGNKAAGK